MVATRLLHGIQWPELCSYSLALVSIAAMQFDSFIELIYIHALSVSVSFLCFLSRFLFLVEIHKKGRE